MIVCDSTPFIAFSRVNRVSLIHEVLGSVFIPQAVQDELLIPDMPGSKELEKAVWIEVRAIENVALLQSIPENLGDGERKALALAKELSALFISDDRDARIVARKLNIPISGSLTILTKAKEMKIVPSIKPLLDEMRSSGYFVADKLYEKVLSDAGEEFSE